MGKMKNHEILTVVGFCNDILIDTLYSEPILNIRALRLNVACTGPIFTARTVEALAFRR